MSAPPPSQSPHPDSGGRGLTGIERAIAGILGVLGIGAGGTGVFLSANQAGTATILLIGAAFFVMAVQGTALLKISKDGGEYERRDSRRASDLINRAEAAIQADDPGAASKQLGAAEVIYPSIRQDQQFRAVSSSLYEAEVVEALSETLGPDVFPNGYGLWRNYRIDNIVYEALIVDNDKPTRQVAIDVMSSDIADSNTLLQQLTRTVSSLSAAGIRLLIVTNYPASKSLTRRLQVAYPDHVRFVFWRGNSETDRLREAVADLLGPVPS